MFGGEEEENEILLRIQVPMTFRINWRAFVKFEHVIGIRFLYMRPSVKCHQTITDILSQLKGIESYT